MKKKGRLHMKYLVTAEEMKKCDRHTIGEIGILSLVLMERAALSVLQECKKRKADLSAPLVVCGVGNNGGDGLVLARLFFCMGKEVTLVIVGNLEKATEEFRENLKIAENLGIKWYSDIPKKEYTIVVDCIFGVGLSREISGGFKEKIEQMNRIHALHIAVDIPSGIHADTGAVMGCAFWADITVTFAFPKIGMSFYPGRQYCGEVVVADVGIMEYGLGSDSYGGMALEEEDIPKLLPVRKPDSNKGSYGKLLLVVGSKNMAGAACFAAKAAYYAGCGLVRILTAEENRVILQQRVPEAVLYTYSKKDTAKELKVLVKEASQGADAVGIGSGLSMGKQAAVLLKTILKQAEVPILMDADALNLLAGQRHEAEGYPLPEGIPIVMTPHLGEMSRLSGEGIGEIKRHPVASAKEFAEREQVFLVQKDAVTVMAFPGKRTYINQTGTPGMAVAGSGDVLAGFLSGLLAQGMEAEKAVPLGVYLHGVAGSLAADKKTEISMTASDLLEALPEAIRGKEK